MLTKVLELLVIPPYGLHVRFNNGQAGVHGCSKLVLEPGPMIEPLRDPALFARAFLEFGAPTWPNGFDMSPEWLRREMLAAVGQRGVRRSSSALTSQGLGP
jgi:Protein of unknown function (DUF2442)